MKSYFPDILKMLKVNSGNLLEIGSGEGDFLIHASQNSDFKVQGYDVIEHAGRDTSRKARVTNKLINAGLNKQDYIWLSNKDPLPLKDDSFNVIVSIQTLEHVKDTYRLFSEIQRLLKPGGLALHYFPSAEILVDPHSGVPLAHKYPKRRKGIISFFSLLRLSKYKLYANKHNYSRNEFINEFDDYLSNKCFYQKRNHYINLSEKIGLESWCSPPYPFHKFLSFTKLTLSFTSIYLFQKKLNKSLQHGSND